MSDTRRRTSITVHSDEDDDEVIQAGRRSSSASMHNETALRSEVAHNNSTNEHAHARHAHASATVDKPSPSRHNSDDPNRMITTEEDLHAQVPFAKMKRTIMIVVLIFIVAFIVYWVITHSA
ncbi:MAG: hypothetical protein LKF61_00225 [Eggerthellaceae bacterium]|mgnify:CR=1 FL=1|jgi:cobalamin biosynthesis Mg chelatase CobN|nr:hypothetical protein [Eggerthellaceae bacterium]MCH4220395.1 hypothetical protein [Eggerthellaceae bacterium]